MSSSLDEPDGLKLEWKRGLPLLLVAIIGLAGLLLVVLAPDDAGPRRATADVRIGAGIPDLVLSSLDGSQPISLRDFTGSPLVIMFWARWCPSCSDALQLLEAGQRRHDSTGLEVLGIVHDDEASSVPRASAAPGFDLRWALDPDGLAWDAFGAIDLPVSYFFDARGELRSVALAPLSEISLTEHLASIGVTGSGAS